MVSVLVHVRRFGLPEFHPHGVTTVLKQSLGPSNRLTQDSSPQTVIAK